MIAYKKLVIVDTPYGRVVMSPVRGTAWELKNGYFYLSCDESVLNQVPYQYPAFQWLNPGKIMPRGIYSCKTPEYEELNQYGGSIVEISIGGTVIERERGYRSSEACFLRVISEDRNFPESLLGSLLSCNAADMKKIGMGSTKFMIDYAIQSGKDSRLLYFGYYRFVESVTRKFKEAFYPDAERELRYGYWRPY